MLHLQYETYEITVIYKAIIVISRLKKALYERSSFAYIQ
ncbi:hypothetical protein GPLA_3025 [Paraglaciecola polaris LMG 21857]|uniref:Uncharacterized protein n=1 Tax=Paraglaciecola polaris LMG 21857 TaxID=1129793 RepID=K6ZYW2_9ALTE|nr:hypothetical protein GPLA_3025 [Paraglaciecola polaris LMG 21857]